MIPLGFEPRTQQRFDCTKQMMNTYYRIRQQENTSKKASQKDAKKVIPLGIEPRTQLRFDCISEQQGSEKINT